MSILRGRIGTPVTPEPALKPADLLGSESLRGFSWVSGVILTASGRSAYALGLRMLQLPEQARVLLPALCCDSLVTATKAAGAVPLFYELRDDLQPDLDWIERHIGRADVFVAVHYLGFPQPINEIGEFCKRAGMPLIEDCAHALYSRSDGRPLGSLGAFSFFSLRKILPTPDGGILAWNDTQRFPPPFPPCPSTSEFALTAKYLARSGENALRISPRAWLLKNENLRRAIAKRDAATALVFHGPTRMSQRVLSRSDAGAVVALRRRNYDFLLGSVDGHTNGSPFPRPLC
ncbi:MAG: DegT/DnrJ/EryC1/StrS aminotransferase family protein, partial [Candidatus Lindowbacteria bacterium]|nr:DegT/DnrJ/EryC1/StrS aminotransferase family protein [Candidatus Lindowbacteria bacterium]